MSTKRTVFAVATVAAVGAASYFAYKKMTKKEVVREKKLQNSAFVFIKPSGENLRHKFILFATSSCSDHQPLPLYP